MPAQPYSVDIQLRWGDMDAYGHINNVEYHRLLEQARVVGLREWFAGTGVDMLQSGVVVARQEIEYLTQLSYRPEPVHIDMWVSRISGGSFDVGYEVRDPSDVGTTVYARAESTLVCFEFASGRPRRLTEVEREVFAGLAGPEVPFRRRRVTS